MRRLLILLLLLLPASAIAEARVIDGDTLELDGVVIRLEGIDAPEQGQRCAALGRPWPCGEAASAYLASLTEGAAPRCAAHGQDRYGRTLATCRVGGEDLGALMVRRGLAWAYTRFSDAYVADEDAARAAGLGVWRNPTETAWAFRRKTWRKAAQTAPKGCPIKGNISANGRIYHTPWSRWYGRTRINLAKGERWFCDEAEALRAGWRPPRR